MSQFADAASIERNRELARQSMVRWAILVVALLVVVMIAVSYGRWALLPRTPLPPTDQVTKVLILRSGQQIAEIAVADWPSVSSPLALAAPIPEPATPKSRNELRIQTAEKNFKIQPLTGESGEFMLLSESKSGAWSGRAYRPLDPSGVAGLFKEIDDLPDPAPVVAEE